MPIRSALTCLRDRLAVSLRLPPESSVSPSLSCRRSGSSPLRSARFPRRARPPGGAPPRHRRFGFLFGFVVDFVVLVEVLLFVDVVLVEVLLFVDVFVVEFVVLV